MKVIVGLGNPGLGYRNTRHNAGFLVIDQLSAERGIRLTRRAFRGKLGEGPVGSEAVLLFQPQTFMNLSGQAVGALVKFHKLPLEDLLVICDDLYLPPGRLRLRKQGSDGGHRGLKSIVQHLGKQNFPRLRLGIGEPEPGLAGESYVLQKFPKAEKPVVEAMIDRAAQCALTWVYHGIEEAMNRFNGED
jgi:peptidyl-tRNA hydrolase, PTH1 family